MLQIVLVGIGAGLAAALLFAAPLGGTSLALPLFALTGLPIAIAGLGWTAFGALVATAVGSLVILFTFSTGAAAILGLVFGLPITWLVRQAALSRPTNADDPNSPREWYPTGNLLLHAAVAVAVGAVIAGAIVGYDPDRLADEMVDALAAWLASSPETASTGREQIEAFVRLNIGVLPVSIGVLTLTVIVLDLWLGAWIAGMSGRIRRPRDRMWTVELPRAALIGLGFAILVSLVPGWPGNVGKVFAGTLGCAAALVGLAVMHALTIGKSARGFLLAFAYAVLFVFGFPLLLFALLGIAETFLRFRTRRFGGAPPTS